MLLMPQRQAAIATDVDFHRLDIGFPITEIVLRCQQLANGSIAIVVVNRSHFDFIISVVVEDPKQAQKRAAKAHAKDRRRARRGERRSRGDRGRK